MAELGRHYACGNAAEIGDEWVTSQHELSNHKWKYRTIEYDPLEQRVYYEAWLPTANTWSGRQTHNFVSPQEIENYWLFKRSGPIAKTGFGKWVTKYAE